MSDAPRIADVLGLELPGTPVPPPELPVPEPDETSMPRISDVLGLHLTGAPGIFAAARIGDPVTHDMSSPCGMIGPPVVPPAAGPVFIEGLPAANLSCLVSCLGMTSSGIVHPPPPATPPSAIVLGSPTVFINGFPAARWSPSGDTTACGSFLGDPKRLPLRTVFIGGISGAALLAQKAARRKQRKHLLALGKARAAKMSYDSARDALQAAIERFEFNLHGIEMANLSQNVYRPEPGHAPQETPVGWKNVSDDPAKLEAVGLRKGDLEVGGSNYRAQLYEPDRTVFGDDMKTTLAFKGTDKTNLEDWQNNLDQGLDRDSLYYTQAVGAGRGLLYASAEVEITGHSLGGGLASAASRTSGRPATTFNAAGLHPNTVHRYGGRPIIPKEENIHVYQVDGDIVTGAQESGPRSVIGAVAIGAAVAGPVGIHVAVEAVQKLADMMPDAIGVRHELPGSGIPTDRHLMVQVIAGIEAQKQEDQTAIARFAF